MTLYYSSVPKRGAGQVNSKLRSKQPSYQIINDNNLANLHL